MRSSALRTILWDTLSCWKCGTNNRGNLLIIVFTSPLTWNLGQSQEIGSSCFWTQELKLLKSCGLNTCLRDIFKALFQNSSPSGHLGVFPLPSHSGIDLPTALHTSSSSPQGWELTIIQEHPWVAWSWHFFLPPTMGQLVLYLGSFLAHTGLNLQQGHCVCLWSFIWAQLHSPVSSRMGLKL